MQACVALDMEGMMQLRAFVRLRPYVAFAAATIAVGMLSTSASGAVRMNEAGGPSYLALGDSVVFGFISGDGFAYTNANNFVGYPDYAGRDLGLNPVNASCPGEATGGFQT